MMKAAGFTGEEIAAVLVSIDKMKKINGKKMMKRLKTRILARSETAQLTLGDLAF
jgi:hypothetical protein